MTPPARDERWDASNAVRLCDRCELEIGTSAGADVGDRGCSWCGRHSAPNVYVGLAAHEAALAAARQVDDAAAERAWDAYCEARDNGEDEPVVVMRAALLAALTIPESDTESDTSAAANGLSVPAHLEAEADRLENNAMLCRFPECAYEQEALEADLAALREAAQAVVDIWAKPETIDSATDLNAAIDDLASALRAVLASADIESREETP